MEKRFFLTKFYPVDVNKQVIIDDPSDTESELFVRRGYPIATYIGIRGKRLNARDCYEDFTVIEKGA